MESQPEIIKKHELLNKTYPTDIKTIVILKNNKTYVNLILCYVTTL